MDKKILLFIFALLSVQLLLAQQMPDTLSGLTNRRPHYIIKWAPLSVIELDNTVQFGLEYLLPGPWSVQQELGYGWFNLNNNADIDGDPYKNREVWRSRTEFRVYLDHNKDVAKPRGGYFALEFLYKRVNFEREASIGRECADGQCEYFELLDYKILKDVFGYHAKFGGQFIVENRLAIDIYSGIGWRNIFVKSPGLSAGENVFGEGSDLINIARTEPGIYRTISLCGGFKLGYLIYRKSKK